VNTLIVLNQTDEKLSNQNFDFVIGVDGGCKWCIENDIKIDLAVGDFDSLENHYFEQLAELATEIEQHPRHKNLTDLELALQAALAQSASILTVLGVWGGRTDHALANLFCLTQLSGTLPVVMPGNEQSGFLLKSAQQIVIEHEIGQTVSIMAMIDDCHGVSNTGMQYPLVNATIRYGSGLGISNETLTNPASIALETGVLLVLTDNQSKNQIIS